MLELDSDFDPATRQLCPDGACTGVLDAQGLCKVCGARGEPSSAEPDASPAEAAVADVAAEAEHDGLTAAADADDLEQRQLCPDGACIGVIGPDGRCKECGRAAEG